MITFKKYFLIFLLLELFFSYAPAYAQTASGTADYTNSGVEAQIRKYLCAPSAVNQSQTDYTSGALNGTSDSIVGQAGLQQYASTNNNNGNDLFLCINQLYKVAIVIASVVGVLMIVIAGYYYISSDGNQESVDKAKNIIQTTIASLVILFAGYLLLKGINPDLIQFHSITPPSVSLQIATSTPYSNVATTTGPGATVSGNAQQIAQQILSSSNITLASVHSSGIADNANALQNIKDTAAGKPASRSNYQGAPGDTVTLNENMLKAILTMGQQYKFSISEIAGGSHAADNANPASAAGHYGGNSFDINVFNGDHLSAGDKYITQVMNLCKANGAGQVIDESVSANHVHCGNFP